MKNTFLNFLYQCLVGDGRTSTLLIKDVALQIGAQVSYDIIGLQLGISIDQRRCGYEFDAFKILARAKLQEYVIIFIISQIKRFGVSKIFLIVHQIDGIYCHKPILVTEAHSSN